MKTKDIDTSNPYNEAIVDCLRILNAHSKSGGNHNFYTNNINLVDDRLIQPIREKIKKLVK